jgi:uncharacterized membrane protein
MASLGPDAQRSRQAVVLSALEEPMEETFTSAIHWITRIVEVGGIAIILVGAAVALVKFLLHLARPGARHDAVGDFRSSLGRSILLGLEFLVAADIINTVAIEPNLDSLAVLAGIVLIRTFLSFSLEVEIEGRWPWQRAPRPSSDGA